MDLKERLTELVNENLQSDQHFLVDIIITAKNGPKKVLILLDGDEGINIDDCAKVSRIVGHTVEEEELITEAYRLEVSSPGLDHPLMLLRQYEKNVGRKVKVTLNNGETPVGTLQSANADQIVVVEKSKKESKEYVLLFTDIKKTEVQVTF